MCVCVSSYTRQSSPRSNTDILACLLMRHRLPAVSEANFFMVCHCDSSSLTSSLFLRNYKETLNYFPRNISENLIQVYVSVGMQALIPAVILSLGFERAVNQSQALLCLSVVTEHRKQLMWQQQPTLIHPVWDRPSAEEFSLRTRCWNQSCRACFMTGNEPLMSSQSCRTKGKCDSVICLECFRPQSFYVFRLQRD